MPSTYTNNLGIEKPGDGEQDGVWGTIVNENSDILDRAVNGVLPLALVGTSSTLTTSDGNLSNGQYKLLLLTGTPSGTHTITISPNDAQKIYYVRNTTAQSVIFTQGTGGNVTLASGDTAIIYANGGSATATVSNFTDHLSMSSPNITGGTITGATISGITDLAIADGGTGASTAAGALTNFGITVSAAQINTAMPTGGIIIWSGSAAAIPTGWLLCNGTSGTPNLMDRFIVGAGSTYAVGATGGAATVTLALADLPAHTHTVSGTSGGQSADHSHGGYTDTPSLTGTIYGVSESFAASGQADGVFAKGAAYNVGGTPQNTDVSNGSRFSINVSHSHNVATYGASNGHTHTFSATSSSIGSGAAHENRPPYYALCYIMKA